MPSLAAPPRRSVLIWITAGIIFICVQINVIYLIFSPKTSISQNFLIEQDLTADKSHSVDNKPSIKVSLDNIGDLMSFNNMHIQNDGSLELNIRINLAEMVKQANAQSDGSYNGEMTSNPIPSNFSFVMSNDHVCRDAGQDLKVLIYIHTSPGNNARRKILRSTWANDIFKDFPMRRIFLMGKPKDEKEQAIIQNESETYKDIVVGDFQDNYRNLTFKGIMGLKWTTLYCPQVKYTLKADDDAFVNIFEIRNLMQKHENKNKVVICPLWKDKTMPILRDPSKCMKWCVRFNEFPGRTHFPKYCAGLAFIMSRNIVPDMYHASFSTPFFWIDDVYISGMLAPKVPNLEYVDILKNFTLKENIASEEYLDPKKKEVNFYLAHVKTEAKFYKMWNATLHRLSASELAKLKEDIIQKYPTLKRMQASAR